MTLTGWKLGVALGVVALAGVGTGSFLAGWKSARGLPSIEVSTDAGVRLTVDAGVNSRADCSATIEHWTTVYVPGPVRYIPAPDGGLLQRQPETIAILVPDVALRGSGGSTAVLQAEGQAEASTRVLVAPAAPERHWEAGPAALYGFSTQQVLWGAVAGWSSGPFGVRLQVMKGPGDVYAGGALVWRW